MSFGVVGRGGYIVSLLHQPKSRDKNSPKVGDWLGAVVTSARGVAVVFIFLCSGVVVVVVVALARKLLHDGGVK